ncbi:Golgin subfamily B member 1, partial [Galemys pyrenaicus]
EAPPELDMENTEREDNYLERLAYAEQLVLQLKEVIRQKDLQLQEKDELLQEERKTADNKIKILKLHKKAKITSLNKHIEKLKAQNTVLLTATHSEDLLPKADNISVNTEEFAMMKQQLQEKEEIISILHAQLSQTQAEQAAQLSSMQQVVREKDARFETQVRLHEDELLKLVTQTDVETEMRQKMIFLQQKLEEHEEALLGRAQVIDLLQQELNAAEQKNQSLSQQLMKMEGEHTTFVSMVETERQETKVLNEKIQLEVAQKELSLRNLQEEKEHLVEQLERAGQAHAEIQYQYTALQQRHREEVEEKASHILNLQETERELRSICDELKNENTKLLQDQRKQALHSAQAIQQLESDPQLKPKEISEFMNKPVLQEHETASQTCREDNNDDTKAHGEGNIDLLQKRVVELENEKKALLLASSTELEALKAENQKLSSQITLLEAQNKCEETDGGIVEISVADTNRLNKSNLPTEESGQDVLENTFYQKHKELSVLLQELEEAQEELALLKSQLQSEKAEGDPEVNDQKKVEENEGISPDKMKILLENTAQFPTMLDDDSSLPAVEKEVQQMSTTHQNGTSEEAALNDTAAKLKLTKEDDADKAPPEIPGICQCHQDELERMKNQILELKTNHSKAAEIYEKNLDAKMKEISNLTQLIEEYKKNAETTNNEFTALCEENKQLLSQVKELGMITELRAQIKQLEVNLADAAKQKRVDYENQTTHHNLLTEQIYSLTIETKSKDMKIEILQNELDDVQHQFSEHSTLIKSLQNELQKKESEVLEGTERERDLSSNLKELVQALSQKELQIAQMDQLLQEKDRDVETLQQTIEEKDQQVTEISLSMTEKIVQLNEEKFSLGVEIKTLKEQLNLLSRAEEAKKEQVEDKEIASDLKQNFEELSPPDLVNKELQHELDLVKKESEQRKRKLQAALINRKELLQRVSRLEEELAKVKDESRNENEKSKVDEDNKSREDPEKCVASKCQDVETSLKQIISEKEVELERVRKDLVEKVAEEEQLQMMLKQMTQNLQEKTNKIDLLQAEILENQAVIQELTIGNKDAGDGDSATVKETVTVSPPGTHSGEHWQPELEEKILGLEKEKEQLEKKLRAVLASRKVVLKKAQEKEKHLREELKQQKDDFHHLQEEFDVQSKENEKIRDQLKEFQIQVRESIDKKFAGTDQQKPDCHPQDSEEPSFKATKKPLAQPVLESGISPDWPPLSGDASTEQIKAQLKEIEAEKEMLNLKVSSTTNELTEKSEEVLQLQEQVNKQGLEIQNLKTTSHEATAQAESLRQKLENCQLEIAGLEHLRELQPALDRLQNLISEKEEEIGFLLGQLSEKETALDKVQTQIMEKEDLIKVLHTQLEVKGKEHEEEIKQLQLEICEIKQKLHENEGSKAKQQIQRKLQAALISRKEALKANKDLQEELSLARETIEYLTKSLADVESQVSAQNKEKDVFIGKLALLQEEKDKLITEMDKSLVENQSLNGSCESLKLALEGLTEDKENLLKEMESLKCSKIAESTEWQEKHKELQKEYEILLQSYENVSNEAERFQQVVETLRREKQELFGKLKSTETHKKETERQLQEAEQEMEKIKEKMRKFAKSKQARILKLEEENDRLRAEVHPADALHSSSSDMKEELERIKRQNETLSKEFHALMTEKNILSEEVQNLKHQMEGDISKQISLEPMEKQDSQMDIMEKAIQPGPDEANEQDYQSTSIRPENSESVLSENSVKPERSESISTHDEINNYLQQIDQLKERIAELEEKRKREKEFIQTLENERNTLLNKMSAKDDELTKINLLYQQIQEELTRITKLKETAEEEKDDLEERLMNQLAELNGNIGNYYQDVTDAQIKNELLESEMQNLKRCVSELEEEKQQLIKEKTLVESEIRKEYLEKLQGAQKGPSNKSHAKELQELLKEKQREVKQMQKDCIRYQGKISALERTVKALEFVQAESQKDLEITKGKLAQANEHHKKAETELASFKVLLDDTQSEAARVLADNLKLERELQSHKESVKSQMKQKDEDLERQLEQAEEKHLKEKKNMQEKLDALYREKVQLEETFGEIRNTLNRKDKEVRQLQENLDSTVAQLAAFTKSMSSLQDDRDRVIDEAKKWERKFSDAIQTKEEEIRFKEESCSVLKDQVRQMSIHIEELEIKISRLEHDKQIWESKAQTEVQLQQKVCDTLQGENKELLSQLEETRHLYHNSQTELAKLQSELEILRDQLIELNNSLEKYKENKENLEGIVKQQEADIQHSKFNCEQLETDLQVSKELTSKLHEEINMKEQKIISLLTAKEQAIQIAIAEVHDQHDKEIKELENLLSQEEDQNVVLEVENKKPIHRTSQLIEILKNIKRENIQQKAQLNSFIKSMSSLQDDRDRIVCDYQQLEERHLSVILGKDQLIQDAATENNKLKGEILILKIQIDDLNSQNAKLDAELIQYREDLNQVISRKDCQQRQLLEVQLQENKELKSECAKLGEKLKQSEEEKEDLQRSLVTLQEEKQGLSKEIERLHISTSQLQTQLRTMQDESISKFQAQLKVKEEEVEKLGATLSSSQKRIAELELELADVQKEAEKKISEIEDKFKKELKHFHHDAGIMRNETETAEERVAELARDLVEMEQKLLTVTKENKDLSAQIQSFRKSMSSLQNSRDNANEELDVLKRKYNASLKELQQLREEQGLLNRERESLVSKADFPVNSTQSNCIPHLEKLNQQLLSKDEQLLHLSSQLEASYNQVQSFSKAMASLQNERDHLLNELEKFRKSVEGKQRSAAPSASNPVEMQSLKRAMSSLQNDRDRLLKELKNLQQQYLESNEELTELRPLKAQLQDYEDKTRTFHIMQEELRQENLSCQHELQQLRMEKNSWEIHERRMKDQYLMALSDKDQQLSHLQGLMREWRASSSQTETLKVPYQRQFSQLLEEKNTLSIQLCDTNQSLRENQQHYSNLFNHCAVLERRVQELQVGSPPTDVAPEVLLEKNSAHRKNDSGEQKDPQLSFSEAQHQLSSTEQDINELRKLLEEERDQRVAVEAALSMANQQIQRLEQSEWDSARTPIMGSCGSQEQTLLIDLPESSCRRVRRVKGGTFTIRLAVSRARVVEERSGICFFQVKLSNFSFSPGMELGGNGSYVLSTIPGPECLSWQPSTFSRFIYYLSCVSQAIYKLIFTLWTTLLRT